MIPEPEVKTFDLQESDQFMIMASDGVWEFITSQVNTYFCMFVMHDDAVSMNNRTSCFWECKSYQHKWCVFFYRRKR